MTAMRTRHAVARFALAALAAASASGIAVTTSTPAWADTHADAVKAFEEGRKLRETDAEKAARAFERSVSLEPSIGAYYNLGQVNEQLDRPRDAVDAFRTAEKLAVQKSDTRNKDARDAWTKILDTHNYVVLAVSNEVKSAPGLAVIVDDVPVPEAQLVGEVFRPTTTHEIVVRATGRKDVRLAAVPNRQAVAITLGIEIAPTTAPTPTPEPPPEPASGGWGWQKWTGVGMMAVGAGGVAYTLIGILGYTSKQRSLDDARQPFASPKCTGAAGRFDRCTGGLDPAQGNAAFADYAANEQSAKDSEPVWIIVGSASALLIGAGVYLFATAPARTSELPPPAARATHWQVIPRVGLHDSGLGVVGTF